MRQYGPALDAYRISTTLILVCWQRRIGSLLGCRWQRLRRCPIRDMRIGCSLCSLNRPMAAPPLLRRLDRRRRHYGGTHRRWRSHGRGGGRSREQSRQQQRNQPTRHNRRRQHPHGKAHSAVSLSRRAAGYSSGHNSRRGSSTPPPPCPGWNNHGCRGRFRGWRPPCTTGLWRPDPHGSRARRWNTPPRTLRSSAGLARVSGSFEIATPYAAQCNAQSRARGRGCSSFENWCGNRAGLLMPASTNRLPSG